MQTKSKEIIVTADGSPSLLVPSVKETYHSRHGAQTESNYVFIEKGLKHWLALHSSVGEIRILEVGLGTGLNAFLTHNAAQKNQLNIYYHSLEKYPLSLELISQMDFGTYLGKEYNREIFRPLHESPWEVPIRLSPYFQILKSEMGFEEFHTDEKFDLLYYDAFGAHAQPEMWMDERMAQAASLLKSGGVWVSYCAKGSVRRALEASGFLVERLEGPPGKREMLRAIQP